MFRQNPKRERDKKDWASFCYENPLKNIVINEVNRVFKNKYRKNITFFLVFKNYVDFCIFSQTSLMKSTTQLYESHLIINGEKFEIDNITTSTLITHTSKQFVFNLCDRNNLKE